MRGSDDGVAFPVTHLLAMFNMAWPLADRAAVRDLSAPVTPAQVALAPGLLVAQVLVSITASGFVGIHMQIDALMGDLHLGCNLLGAPLNAQVKIHIGPDFGIYTAGMTASLCPLSRLGAGLFGAIATLATTTAEFAADGAVAPAQQSGNLADGLFGFQEAVNLVSFFSAEVLVH